MRRWHPPHVHEQCAALDRIEEGFVHEALRLRRQGQGAHDHIGARCKWKQLVRLTYLRDIVRTVGAGVSDRDHGHAERMRSLRDFSADPAEPDDEHGATLRLPHAALRHGLVGPLAFDLRRNVGREAACQAEHECEHVLCHDRARDLLHVRERDAALGESWDRNAPLDSSAHALHPPQMLAGFDHICHAFTDYGVSIGSFACRGGSVGRCH